MHFADTDLFSGLSSFPDSYSWGLGGCWEFYEQKLNTKLMDISVPVIIDITKHLIQ